MGQPVVHFEIISEDVDAARAYYGALFGWEFDTGNPMDYGVVKREDNLSPQGWGISGGIGPAMPGYGGHVTFYVGVDDVEAALARAEELGGTRLMGPHTVPDGPTLGQFADLEGRVIGVVTDSV